MLGYRQARFSNETPAKFVLTQASFVGNQVMSVEILLHKVRDETPATLVIGKMRVVRCLVRISLGGCCNLDGGDTTWCIFTSCGEA
jgi:hypothetical protein